MSAGMESSPKEVFNQSSSDLVLENTHVLT